MTSIEWLWSKMKSEVYSEEKYFFASEETLNLLFEQAKEMHKQEIINAFELWRSGSGEQYYQETFVSKGSSEVELPKHPSVISENGNELFFDKQGKLNIVDFQGYNFVVS